MRLSVVHVYTVEPKKLFILFSVELGIHSHCDALFNFNLLSAIVSAVTLP